MRSILYLISSGCLVFAQQPHFILYDRDFNPKAPTIADRNNEPVNPNPFRGLRYPKDKTLSVYALNKETGSDLLQMLGSTIPLLSLPVLVPPSKNNVLMSEVTESEERKTTGYIFATGEAGNVTLDGFSFACAKWALGRSFPVACEVTATGIDDDGFTRGRSTSTYDGGSAFDTFDAGFENITGIYFQLTSIDLGPVLGKAFPNGVGTISIYIDNLRYETEYEVA